ncbi:MAG: type II toxin-antitoxin system VapC family toxin [Wenzhouxiangella sp.]
MRILLDTHLALWAVGDSKRLSPSVRKALEDPGNALFCSTASLWEIAIKTMLRRPDFEVDVAGLRMALRSLAIDELPVQGDHIESLLDLPDIHRDPFDRLIVAQSLAEPLSLWTNDPLVAQYSDTIRLV